MRHRINGMLCLEVLGLVGLSGGRSLFGGVAAAAVIRPVCVGVCVVAGGASPLLHCCQQADQLAPASQTDARLQRQLNPIVVLASLPRS